MAAEPAIGVFALQRRKLERAQEGGDAKASVLFDLRIALRSEQQARHFLFDRNPLKGSGEVFAELGAATGKDKLRLGLKRLDRIRPGMTGDKKSVNPTDDRQATIRAFDVGRVRVISDKPNAKIFEFFGRRLRGRILFVRDGKTARFRVKASGDRAMSDDFSLTELLDDEPLIDVAEFEEISDFVGPAQVMAVIERLMGSTKLNEKDRERLELVKERLERDEVNGEDIAFVALLKRLLLEGGDPLDENEEDFDDDSNKDDDTKIDPDEDFKRLFESMKPIGEHRHAIYADGVSLSFQADSFEIDKELGTVSIFGYEILRTGVWNGIKFESGDLDEIAGNFSKLSTGKTPFVQVPVKLGHHDDQALLTNSGEAAAGMLTKVARKGERLLADIKSIPIKVFELMRRSAFNSRSVELFFGFRNDAGKKFGKVLKALALLGVSTPAVKGMKTLDDLLGLYEFDDSETDREVVVLFFREEEAVSDDTKPTKDADDTKPEPKPEPQPKVQTFSQEDLDKRLAAEREKHEAEMKKLRDEQLRLSESLRVGTRDRNRERNEAVYSSLLNEGKILPKQKAKFLAILNAIDGYEDLASGSEVESVYFSDRGFDAKTLTFEVSTKDDEGKDVTRRESLKTMLVGLFSGLEKQVEFDTKSEEVDSKDTDKKSDDKGTDDGDKPFSERVYDRAVEMQAEAKKDGKDIGLTDALEAASIELAKGLDAEVVNN